MDIIGTLFIVAVVVGLAVFLLNRIQNSGSVEPDLELASQQEATIGHKAGEVVPFKDVLVGEYVKFDKDSLIVYKKIEPVYHEGETDYYKQCLIYNYENQGEKLAWAPVNSNTLVTIVSGE